MTMEQSINEFAAKHCGEGAPFIKKLEFVNDQWGMFVAWLREKHPVLVTIEVRGGVAYDTGNHPGAEVDIVDHDNA